MFQLSNLSSLKKKRKRVGRGGSRGGTSGRGHKGQKSRSGVGGELKGFFEGGQMPLSRRLPRRGFNNSFKKDVRIISLKDLEIKFSAGDVVNVESLKKAGLVKGRGKYYIKILNNGKLSKALTVQADAFSSSAKKVIEEVGGTVKLNREISGDSITS